MVVRYSLLGARCWLGRKKVDAQCLRFGFSVNIGAAILKFMQSEQGTILQGLYLYQAGEVPVYTLVALKRALLCRGTS